MESFRLTPQSIAFGCVIVGVTVVVAVAAPFGSIALGVVALLAIGVVLIKAMLRSRRWWPLTAVEGTVALSGVVLLVGGLAVMGYSMVRLGTGHPFGMTVGWPSIPEGPLPAGRNVHFPDPNLRKQFTDWLAQKGIEHQVVTTRGEDYVVWDENRGDLAREFIESRSAECKVKVAAGKSAGGRC